MQDFLDKLDGKKTLIWNGVAILLSALRLLWPEAELPTPEMFYTLFNETVAVVVGGKAIVDLLLRAVTHKPGILVKE